MFDLDKAIAEWRQQTAAGGIQSPEVLDELESHLREEFERQIESGKMEQDAYATAIALLGDAGALKLEFGKIRTISRRSRVLETCYVTCGVGMLLANGWTLLVQQVSWLERVLGLSVVVVICLYVAGLPYLLRSLTSVTINRLMLGIKLWSTVAWAWPIWAFLEAKHVVHSGIGPTAGVLLWCFWAALALTAFVLAREGQRRPGEDGGTLLPAAWPGPVVPSGPPGAGLPLSASRPFDPVVEQSLGAAWAEANRRGHNYIGTEHVLLGLLRLAEGPLANILRRMNLDPDAARSEIDRMIVSLAPRAESGPIPFTPRARKAVALAAREAEARNQSHVSAEHVLLGLLLEGRGVAGAALRNLGLRPHKIRKALQRATRT